MPKARRHEGTKARPAARARPPVGMLSSFFTSLLDLLGTSLPSYVILSSLGLFFLSLFWSIFTAYIYPDVLGSPEFVTLDGALFLVVSLLFTDLLRREDNQEALRVSSYLELLYTELKEAADRYLSIPHLREMAIIPVMMILNIYSLHSPVFSFTPQGSTLEILLHPSKSRPRPHTIPLPTLEDSRLLDLSSGGSTQQTPSEIFSTISRLKKEAYSLTWKHKEEGRIDGAIYTFLISCISSVAKQMDRTYISMEIRDSPYLRLSKNLLLFAWFFVFFPIRIFLSMMWYAPFAYGIAGTALLSSFIFAYWHGGAFDPDRNVRIVEHEEKTVRVVEDILREIREQ